MSRMAVKYVSEQIVMPTNPSESKSGSSCLRGQGVSRTKIKRSITIMMADMVKRADNMPSALAPSSYVVFAINGTIAKQPLAKTIKNDPSNF